ncbi:MAG: AgmX/PglI C-terminal domain-containing protein, partial [Myxococcota bacterium]
PAPVAAPAPAPVAAPSAVVGPAPVAPSTLVAKSKSASVPKAPSSPLAKAQPEPVAKAQPAPVAKLPPAPKPVSEPIALAQADAALKLRPAPSRGFRLPTGTLGHVLSMAGGALFLIGSMLLPWQRFELAELDLAGFELNLAGLVMTFLGGTSVLASLWGLATGRRHAAARYNFALGLVCAAWMAVAATQVRWGQHLMLGEEVGLREGFFVALFGVSALIGGATGVLGALPHWDESTSFLRLVLERGDRVLQTIIVYVPRVVDLRQEAQHPDLVADPTLLARLPRFRVTREGDTAVALGGAGSARGDQWTPLRMGESGSVEVDDARVAFAFVKPVAGRTPVRLVNWTEVVAFGLLAGLLFAGGALHPVLSWSAEARRDKVVEDKRTAVVDPVITEDKPPEAKQPEVQVEIATPKEKAPEVEVPEDQKFGDERVAHVETPDQPHPIRKSILDTVVPRDESNAAKDELMKRLMAPQEGSGARLADIQGTVVVKDARLGEATKLLDSLPDGSPGFAKDGAMVATGPIAGDAADAITKKLAAPAKPTGPVRGKVTGMKSATKVSGQLDPGQVYGVIDANIARIQACYESRLQVDASLAGRITFRWVVTPTGAVTGVQQYTSTVADPKVAACIKAVLERLHFPKPVGGNVEISYPFIFRSS